MVISAVETEGHTHSGFGLVSLRLNWASNWKTIFRHLICAGLTFKVIPKMLKAMGLQQQKVTGLSVTNNLTIEDKSD